MQDRNNPSESFNTDSSSTRGENKMANKGRGPQGVDKAPGEETSQDPHEFVEITQKGKKVDADPSKPSGQPVEEDI